MLEYKCKQATRINLQVHKHFKLITSLSYIMMLKSYLHEIIIIIKKLYSRL